MCIALKTLVFCSCGEHAYSAGYALKAIGVAPVIASGANSVIVTSYLGDYMNQYSWAEYVHAELDEISYAMEDWDTDSS